MLLFIKVRIFIVFLRGMYILLKKFLMVRFNMSKIFWGSFVIKNRIMIMSSMMVVWEVWGWFMIIFNLESFLWVICLWLFKVFSNKVLKMIIKKYGINLVIILYRMKLENILIFICGVLSWRFFRMYVFCRLVLLFLYGISFDDM